MAEYILLTPTEIEDQALVPFTDAICTSCSVKHRNGSGIITLRGGACGKPARFRAHVHLNVSGIAGVEQLVLTLDGEPLPETLMATVAVAATNVTSLDTETEICTDCPCARIGIRNISDAALTINTASIIIDREA